MFELAAAQAHPKYAPGTARRAEVKKPSSTRSKNDSPELGRSSIGSSPSMRSFAHFSMGKKKEKQASVASRESMSESQPESRRKSKHDSQCESIQESQGEVEVMERLPLAPTPLPELPPNEPLPQEETDDYDAALEKAVHELQNDFTSGARQLADASLSHLAYITDIAACMATSWGEFWAMMVHAAKHLSYARPSMSAAITSCLLRALELIAKKWNEEQAKGSQSSSQLARIAGGTFDEILRDRRQLGDKLGKTFAQWLRTHCTEVLSAPFTFSETIRADAPQRIDGTSVVRILALSNSSTIRTAILHALSTMTDVVFHLTVMESRPRCEGADMAAQIYASACDRDRLSILVIPDCAVGTAVGNIDILLLGADRISSTGDVSNKIGSLAAAICAKHLNKNVAVVTLSDVDKIAAPGQDAEAVERHPPSELTSAWPPATRNQLEGKGNVEVFGEWFEWVPASAVDVYVTDLGIWGTKDVQRMAGEIGALDEYIFQQKKA